eukprot:scaffold8905_cov75-Phaeocystis_antarctica.AAC.1
MHRQGGSSCSLEDRPYHIGCTWVFRTIRRANPAPRVGARCSTLRVQLARMIALRRCMPRRRETTTSTSGSPPVPLPDGGRAGTGGRDFVYANSLVRARDLK